MRFFDLTPRRVFDLYPPLLKRRGGRISKSEASPLFNSPRALAEVRNMVMEIKLGDIVRLKKKHPCGSYEWQVVRLGADIGIKCLKCQHRVLLERSVFERRVKEFISRGE